MKLFLILLTLLLACSKGPALNVGTAQMLTKDVVYQVSGTDLVVVNRGAGMQTVLVDGDPNKEDHVFFIELEVTSGEQKQTIQPTSKQPVEFAGYRFRAEPDGYTWGSSDGAVVVERLR